MMICFKNFTQFSLDDDESNDSSSMVSIECTYVLFTVNGIKTNISSYLLLAIITYFLFSIIYFVKCGLPKLKSKIKNIINFKQTQNNQITSGSIGKKNDINSPPLRNKIITNDNYNRRFER